MWWTPCGCFMTQPACSFYRITQKPVTKRVYEVIRCNHWNPKVTLEVEINVFGRKNATVQEITPYISTAIDILNVTVVSIQKPSNVLINKRFAISKNVSYVIPDDFRVPVECNSYEQAQNSFENCIKSKMRMQ